MTTTYEQLATENLITFNLTSVSSNFRTIDTFIKNFSSFQRRFIELEKYSKQTSQDLTNFKLSTQNTFSTISDMLESRQGSKSRQEQEQLSQIKKQIKQLKSFLAESTQTTLLTQEQSTKQAEQREMANKEQFSILLTQLESTRSTLSALSESVSEHRQSTPSLTDHHRAIDQLTQVNDCLQTSMRKTQDMYRLLESLNVQELKGDMESVMQETEQKMQEMRGDLSCKVSASEQAKLEDMLLNHMDYMWQTLTHLYSTKSQSKKALIFLEKRINQVCHMLLPTQETVPEDGLVTVKKCISCSKDLNDYEGKFDKVRWGNVPIKDSFKEKSLIDSGPKGKGIHAVLDSKIETKKDFRLSQSRLPSPHKSRTIQTNYMVLFGKNESTQINIKEQYYNREQGVLAFQKKNI